MYGNFFKKATKETLKQGRNASSLLLLFYVLCIVYKAIAPS